MSRQLKRKEERTSTSNTQSKSLLFFLFFGFISIVLPVIYNPSTMDLDMMPRVFGLGVLLLVFSILIIVSKRFNATIFSILRQKVFVIFGLWLLVSIITMLLSINPIEGVYDIVKVLFTISIAAFGSMLLLDNKNWQEDIAKMVIFSAIITSIIGFVQYYLWVISPTDLTTPIGGKHIYRVVGVMAHKNLYSLSLFMMLPFTAYGIVIFKKNWRVAAILGLIMALTIVVLLQARATWVGLIMASGLTALILIFWSNRFGVGRKVRSGLIAATIIVFMGLVSLVFLMRTETNNQYINQLQSITDLKSTHNLHRVNIWKSTVEMIGERPIVGYGPNNWKLHVGNFFNGRFYLEDQINWQRPHNDFLWVFAEKGIFGLLLYLALFGIIIFYNIRVILRDDNPNNTLFALALLYLLFGYLFASAFDFPYERIFHQAFLGVVFACSIALYHKTKTTKPLVLNKLIVAIPFCIAFLFATIYGYSAMKQEMYIKLARKELRVINQQIIPRLANLSPEEEKNAMALLQNKWHEVLNYADKAESKFKNLDPQGNPINYYKALAYMNLKDRENGLKYCLDAYSHHPSNIRVLNSLGALYYRLRQFDEAEHYLLKSMNIFPSHDALQNLSATYIQLKEYEKGVELFKDAPKDIMSTQNKNHKKVLEHFLKQQRESKTKESTE